MGRRLVALVRSGAIADIVAPAYCGNCAACNNLGAELAGAKSTEAVISAHYRKLLTPCAVPY